MHAMTPIDREVGRALSSDTVFRREGEYWSIVYGGEVCRLRDSRGLRLLASLLRRPGVPITAVALSALHLRNGERASRDGSAVTAREAEHARVNVTRALKSACEKIDSHLPALGDHLRATLRTGKYCTYTPDPGEPISWAR